MQYRSHEFRISSAHPHLGAHAEPCLCIVYTRRPLSPCGSLYQHFPSSLAQAVTGLCLYCKHAHTHTQTHTHTHINTDTGIHTSTHTQASYRVTAYTNTFPSSGYDGAVLITLHGKDGETGQQVCFITAYSGTNVCVRLNVIGETMTVVLCHARPSGVLVRCVLVWCDWLTHTRVYTRVLAGTAELVGHPQLLPGRNRLLLHHSLRCRPAGGVVCVCVCVYGGVEVCWGGGEGSTPVQWS